eukprot:3370042-Prymnesium_polylepis.1
MQEGHIHAVANLLGAPVVVVDVRFTSIAGLFEPQKLGKRRAAELRLIAGHLGPREHRSFSALVPGV